MKPFTRLTAVAAPLDMADVDTDKIFPSRFGKKLRTAEASYAPWLFYDMRYGASGERTDFVLNQAPYRDAAILVAGPNFGCGSSREAAVYALVDSGIRCVIAPSFGDIHYANQLQNGMLPAILPDEACRALREHLWKHPGARITVDLQMQNVTDADGKQYRFDIDRTYKERLLNGLDDIELVLQHLPEIESFEKRYRTEMPWLVAQSRAENSTNFDSSTGNREER